MFRKMSFNMLMVALLLTVATVAAQSESFLTHHTRDAVVSGQAAVVGHMPSEQMMQVDVVLPLSDREGLQAFLKLLYDPNSSSYRQFLTPKEFTALYGPSQEDYDATVRYLEVHGLTVVGGDRDGMDIQVRGPVSAIESAFHVTMNTYQHPTENRVFYGPDREPTTDLPFALWHVSGMDNYSLPHPRLVRKEDYAREQGIPLEKIPAATTGSGPSASFLGSDMRAAYYGGTALTGSGQNLGLFEYLGTDLADLTTYYKNAKQTNNVPVTLYSTDGTSTSCVYSGQKQVRRHRADAGHDAGDWHGAWVEQPGDVCWLNGHGDHQQDDDVQPVADDDWLQLGLDTG